MASIKIEKKLSILVSNMSFIRNSKFALRNINLTVNEGEILAIVGPNGSGKSTLMSLLAGDIRPTGGRIDYGDMPLETWDLSERADYRSMMSQQHIVAYDFTVREIIEMGIVHAQEIMKDRSYSSVVDIIAEMFELTNVLDHSIRSLSGGGQQRVHFARALAQVWQKDSYKDPKFMLLDEPTSNLDLAHEVKTLSLLRNEVRKGLGVLVILHDLNLTAHFADKVAILKNGELVDHGSADEVLTSEILSSVYNLSINVSHEPLRITHF